MTLDRAIAEGALAVERNGGTNIVRGARHATRVGLLNLAALACTAALPGVAPAQFTCHTDIGIAVTPAGAVAVGDTKTVTLALGAGSIQNGSKVTINRVRYELDCNRNFGLGIPCTDVGDIFTYLGDATIFTDCPTGWSSNVPLGGNLSNEIVFTALSPFDILPINNPFCSLWFAIGLDNAEPTTGSTSDSTPALTEVVAGFSVVDADAVCDNGLVSLGAEAVAIQLLTPVTAATTTRTLTRAPRRHRPR